MNIEEIKKIELSMLIELDNICRKHKINYFLAGGTFLGAIRHKGFIPWDDDIDVGKLRKDYDVFCEICKTELNQNMVLQNYLTEPNCGLIFSKIRMKNTVMSENYSYHINMSQGIWIDIFPFDNSPDNKMKRFFQNKFVFLLKNLYIIKSGYRNPYVNSKIYCIAYSISKIITKPISLKYFISKIEKNVRKYNNQETKYVYAFGGAYPKKDILKKQILTYLDEYLFESRYFTACKDYDLYLKHMYGDYMKLPPKEKRVGGMHTIHEIKILEDKNECSIVNSGR